MIESMFSLVSLIFLMEHTEVIRSTTVHRTCVINSVGEVKKTKCTEKRDQLDCENTESVISLGEVEGFLSFLKDVQKSRFLTEAANCGTPLFYVDGFLKSETGSDFRIELESSSDCLEDGYRYRAHKDFEKWRMLYHRWCF